MKEIKNYHLGNRTVIITSDNNQQQCMGGRELVVEIDTGGGTDAQNSTRNNFVNLCLNQKNWNFLKEQWKLKLVLQEMR